jgi:O-acetyl-ADP-ribose deacetylase (regulator of RNase III)
MHTQVELIIGVIEAEEADVVASAANTSMIMGEGVAAALLHAAGPDVEEEAIAQAPVAVGDVVITSPGNLAAKHIAHVAVVGDVPPDIYECTRNVLIAADELKAETLALPALGTGIPGLNLRIAATGICDAIRDHIEETGSAISVRIVIDDEEVFPIFQRALKRAFLLD